MWSPQTTNRGSLQFREKSCNRQQKLPHRMSHDPNLSYLPDSSVSPDLSVDPIPSRGVHAMRSGLIYVAVSSLFCLMVPVLSGEETQPVRMGCGLMTFDTVPGWGFDAAGKSVLGPTHGAVVIDKAGNIYTSAQAGVFMFSPDGNLLHAFLGKDYSNIHDMEIRDEADGEFIYAARNTDAEGMKFNIKTGEVVLRLPFPEESGLKIDAFNPTAITVAPNGDIFLSNGYASNHIFKFDKAGKYLLHFGSKGNGPNQFNTAHGMTLDTRYDPPRLLICDRNHEPKGRLLHYDLNGELIGEVITGLGMPTSVAIQGDYVSVPDLQGRLVILDKSNTIVAVLGHNSDPETSGNFNVPQDKWMEGVFNASHGSYWDKDGNLYVQDWNVSGRLMKLVRVR
jgi:sugar lactone lactonase YvrE